LIFRFLQTDITKLEIKTKINKSLRMCGLNLNEEEGYHFLSQMNFQWIILMKLKHLPYLILAIVSVALIVSGIMLHKEDPNLARMPHSNGSMTKLEFQGHSYVGWSCNLGSGLVHDPDCQCHNCNKASTDEPGYVAR
jgi:hypothetical protein